MPQEITTSADGMAVVSDQPAHYQSVQTAIENEPEDCRIHVHHSYDRDEDDRITIAYRRELSADKGTKLPPVTVATVHNRPPGALLRGFEAPSVTLKGAKFAVVRDVDTHGEGFKTVSTDSHSCNSVAFIDCTAQSPSGQAGFELGPQSHAAALERCRVVGGSGYGVFVNGSDAVTVSSPQVEDTKEAGIKGRRSESLVVRGAGYVEACGRDPSDADANLTFSDCPGLDVTGLRIHSLDTPTTGISVYGATTGRAQNNRFPGHDRRYVDDADGGFSHD